MGTFLAANLGSEDGAAGPSVSVLRADGKTCAMPLAVLKPREHGGSLQQGRTKLKMLLL